MNAVVVVLIILLVIFLLMFAALAFFYVHIRRSPKKVGGLKQLRDTSYIPAGNVGTTYGGYNEERRMTPDVSDDDDYRPKKKPTYVSDEEEYRPKKKHNYVSSDDEEEEYRPKRKTRKARV